MTVEQKPPGGWQAHDLLVGVLGGASIGFVAGMFLAIRVLGDSVPGQYVLWGMAALGAVGGYLLLKRSHRGAAKFLNVTVVVVWILALFSSIFIWAVARAIENLN